MVTSGRTIKDICLRKCFLSDEIIEHLTQSLIFSHDAGVESSLSQSNFQFGSIKLEGLDLSENWHVTSRGWSNLFGSLGLVAGRLERIRVRDCVLSEVM